MDRISVIIPNYNRAQLIGATIENMLNQSLPPSEIIVVDDGSTDDSVEVIRSFGSRVRLIEQTNQGPGAARNQGLEVASGNYIQFMDSDDLVSLNKLEIQLAAIKSSGADFAYCPWVRSIINNKQIRFAGPILQSAALPEWKSMLEWLMGTWCITFQNCLFRRQTLKAAGRFQTDMRIAEDGEYLVRILLTGAQPVFTDGCLVFYRTNGTDQISGSASSKRQQADDLTKYFERVGESIGNKLLEMNPSTRREAALKLYRHNRYCRLHGWPTVNGSSPLVQLTNSYPLLWLRVLDYWNRINKKFSTHHSETPFSTGLGIRLPGSSEQKLITALGYSIG